MFLHEEINEKYQRVTDAYGIQIAVEYGSGFPKTQEIINNGSGFVIKLNSEKIGAEAYEEYLSYNVRKIILPQLRLATDRLLLRRFDRSDAEDYFALLSDKEDAYMDSGIIFPVMDEEYGHLMDDFAAQMRYSIVLQETGHAIGTINLFEDNSRAVETMEIGYAIAPGYKRRGYAYEALSAFLHYLLYDLNLNLIVAGVIPDNMPSIGLLEKLGFQYEGLKHKAFWNEMRGPVDLRYYYLEKTV